ncbi:hypothetical protein LINPERHAP2_LOCUS7236 [Linum perenne]
MLFLTSLMIKVLVRMVSLQSFSSIPGAWLVRRSVLLLRVSLTQVSFINQSTQPCFL